MIEDWAFPLRIDYSDAPADGRRFFSVDPASYERHRAFVYACDALRRAVAMRTLFALQEDRVNFLESDVFCRIRQSELRDLGLDEAELAYAVRLYSRIGADTGRRWHAFYAHGWPSQPVIDIPTESAAEV